jgi:hypothetical protein
MIRDLSEVKVAKCYSIDSSRSLDSLECREDVAGLECEA